MTWSNWATVADLATALGTLVLAVATFSAVKVGEPDRQGWPSGRCSSGCGRF